MRVGKQKLLVGVLICIFMRGAGAAQSANNPANTPLKSCAEVLRSRGIDLSEPSLIAALQNRDPQIRSLAALKLAEDHDYGAVSPIKNALNSETDPRPKVALSEALWGLHDPEGLTTLQNMCSDAALSIDMLVEVVQHLNIIDRSSAKCAEPILAYLDAHRDSESRTRALPALPDMYRWVEAGHAGRIALQLQDMLSDEAPYVRLEAGHAIAQIHMSSAASALYEAISRETDPVVQERLQDDLNKLER